MTWKSALIRSIIIYFAFNLYFQAVLADVPWLLRFPLFMGVVTATLVWRLRKLALNRGN